MSPLPGLLYPAIPASVVSIIEWSLWQPGDTELKWSVVVHTNTPGVLDLNTEGVSLVA